MIPSRGGLDRSQMLSLLSDDERRLWSMFMRRSRGNRDTRLDRDGNRIYFKLSVFQLRMFLEQAGITAWDWGQGKGKWNLARNEDRGHYEWGNCSFIPQEENVRYGITWRKSNREALAKLPPVSCLKCRKEFKNFAGLASHWLTYHEEKEALQ